MLPVPPSLQLVTKAAAVDEAVSVIRHELRNKLASIRNSVFYLRRKLEKSTQLLVQDPRVEEFLTLMDSELDTCSQLLAQRSRNAASGERGASLDAVLGGLLPELALPPGVRLQVGEVPPAVVTAGPGELELALFTLLENAVEAVEGEGGRIEVSVVEEAGRVRVEVLSGASLGVPMEQLFRPFVSSREGRLGLGLKIVRRLASGWGGKVEVAGEGEAGVLVALILPLASPDQEGQ